MKANQKGFSVVEILIIIVVVGLAAAMGWLVYDRLKNKTADNDVIAQTSQQQETEQETVTSNAEFLEVKEWGVKIPLSDEIRDLSYEVVGKGLNLHDTNQVVIKFFTARLQKAGGVCSVNYSPVSLNRGIASDVPIMGDGPGPEDVLANTYGYLYEHGEVKADGGRIQVGLIKVGTYYYTDALAPGAVCDNDGSDPTADTARNEEPVGAIVEAVKAMQPL